MKFIQGDIVMSFTKRIVYVYSGSILSIYDMLATETEALIYKEHFSNKKSISFAEFKAVMPEFNAKTKSNRIYEIIELDEPMYLFLRAIKLQEPFRNNKYSFLDIIYILVKKQLDNKFLKLDDHRRQTNTSTIEQIKQLLLAIQKNI